MVVEKIVNSTSSLPPWDWTLDTLLIFYTWLSLLVVEKFLMPTPPPHLKLKSEYATVCNDNSNCVDVCFCNNRSGLSTMWLQSSRFPLFCEKIVPTENHWPAKTIMLVNIFHRLIRLLFRFTHLPKKFNDIRLFRLQIHFSTSNFSISKNTRITSRHEIGANFLCTELRLVSMITW